MFHYLKRNGNYFITKTASKNHNNVKIPGLHADIQEGSSVEVICSK